MAVIKAKAEKVVDFLLPIFNKSSVMPTLVTRIGGDIFKGALGDVVNMRVNRSGPVAVTREYEFRTRNADIEFDDIGGGDSNSMPLKIDKHFYSATRLTDEQMTLDEIDLVRDVIGPQSVSVAAKVDSQIEAMINAAHWKDTLAFTPEDEPAAVVAEAKRVLDSYKVAPQDGRVFVVGSNIGAAWAAHPQLQRYDSTGETGTPALRNATIGSLAGVRVVVNFAVDPNYAVYQHPSAFVFSTLAPIVPAGVTKGSARTAGAYGVRWIADYDAPRLRDRSIVSVYYGGTEILDERDADGYLLPDADRTKNVRGIGLTFSGFGAGGVLAQSRARQGLNANGTRKVTP